MADHLLIDGISSFATSRESCSQRTGSWQLDDVQVVFKRYVCYDVPHLEQVAHADHLLIDRSIRFDKELKAKAVECQTTSSESVHLAPGHSSLFIVTNEPMDVSVTVESKALDDSYRYISVVEATSRREQLACADHLLTVNISTIQPKMITDRAFLFSNLFKP